MWYPPHAHCQYSIQLTCILFLFFIDIGGSFGPQYLICGHWIQVLGAAINVDPNKRERAPSRLIEMLSSSHRHVISPLAHLICKVCIHTSAVSIWYLVINFEFDITNVGSWPFSPIRFQAHIDVKINPQFKG